MSAFDDDENEAQPTQEVGEDDGGPAAANDGEDDFDPTLAAAMDDEDYDDDEDDALAAPAAPALQPATFLRRAQGAADEDAAGDAEGEGDEEQIITGSFGPGTRAGEERYEDDDVVVEPDELAEEPGEEAGREQPSQEQQQPGQQQEPPISAPVNAEADRQRKLLMSMTEEQLDRYEAYRRSALPRAKIKKLIRPVGAEPTPEALIALGAIGKLFVGELVELARQLANQQGHRGALTPMQLHTAYQLLDQRHKVPHAVGPKRLFKRL